MLIGSHPTALNPTFRIEDYQLVPRRPEDGPIFMLDPREHDRFATARWERRQDGRTTVGFFRSHRRTGPLRPSLADRTLLTREFAGETYAALLVDASEPLTTALFVGTQGELPDQPSVPEFRLDERSFSSLPEIPIAGPPPAVPTAVRTQPSAFPLWRYLVGALAAIALFMAVSYFWTARPALGRGMELSVTGQAVPGRDSDGGQSGPQHLVESRIAGGAESRVGKADHQRRFGAPRSDAFARGVNLRQCGIPQAERTGTGDFDSADARCCVRYSVVELAGLSLKTDSVFARFQRELAALPLEIAADTEGKSCRTFQAGAGAVQRNRDHACGMRHAGFDLGQDAGIGCNPDPFKPGCGRFDTRDGAQKLKVRAGSPGMAVGACARAILFCPGCQCAFSMSCHGPSD